MDKALVSSSLQELYLCQRQAKLKTLIPYSSHSTGGESDDSLNPTTSTTTFAGESRGAGKGGWIFQSSGTFENHTFNFKNWNTLSVWLSLVKYVWISHMTSTRTNGWCGYNRMLTDAHITDLTPVWIVLGVAALLIVKISGILSVMVFRYISG